MNTQNTKPAQVGHTPGPWSVFGCTVYQDDCWNAGHNEGGQRICSTYSGSDEEQRDELPTDEHSANADFIVKACNNHAALLASCKYAVKLIEGLKPGLVGTETIKEAIARAEGRL